MEDTLPENNLQIAAPNFNDLESHSVGTPASTKTPSKTPEIRNSGQVSETEDRYVFLFSKTESEPQQTFAENSSKQPSTKLPPLHPRQCYWNGERAKLRPYIQRWYDNLEGSQDEEALMFLQQCVPPAYKYIIQISSLLISCL